MEHVPPVLATYSLEEKAFDLYWTLKGFAVGSHISTILHTFSGEIIKNQRNNYGNILWNQKKVMN